MLTMFLSCYTHGNKWFWILYYIILYKQEIQYGSPKFIESLHGFNIGRCVLLQFTWGEGTEFLSSTLAVRENTFCTVLPEWHSVRYNLIWLGKDYHFLKLVRLPVEICQFQRWYTESVCANMVKSIVRFRKRLRPMMIVWGPCDANELMVLADHYSPEWRPRLGTD